MIPAGNSLTRIKTDTGMSGNLIGWDDEGWPLVMNDYNAQLVAVRPGTVVLVEEAAPTTYVSATGWHIAGREEDGTVWCEPIAAWAIKDGTGEPLVPKLDLPEVSIEICQDRSFADCWLVPPGDTPESSPYRPGS